MESTSWILVSLLFLITFVAKNTVVALSIGAILDTNSRIGREQNTAIELAVQQFSDPSHALMLNSTYLTSAETGEASSYAQKLIHWGAKMIISSGTWPQILCISDTNEGASVPTIPLTPYVFLAKPFLVQLSYQDAALVNCFAALVKSFNWRKVNVVYEDDQYGSVSSMVYLLDRALHAIGTELDYSVIIPSSKSVSDQKTMIRDELARIREYKSKVYIVLKSSENLTLSIFQEASAMGMMEKGYIWICGPDVTTLLDSNVDTSFMLPYMQGVIGVSQYINKSTQEYIRFNSEFRQAFKNKYEKDGELFFDPGVYATRAYDTLHAIALAATKSQLNNKSLLENLQTNIFTGLTGLIKPMQDNSLEEGSGDSTFRIVNLVGKSYKEIGFWIEGVGFYDAESQLSINGSRLRQLRVVYWPGGSINIPGGLRRLKVGIPKNPVWDSVIEVEYDKNGNYKSVTGFCIDIFNEALARLNYTIDYDFVPFTIGSEAPNDFSYDDLINEVYLKRIDMAVGDITAVSYRAEKVSFTEPYLTSGLAMVIPLKKYNAGRVLMKPFTIRLWLTILSFLVLNFLAIWYLERNHAQAAIPDFRREWYRQLGATLWIIGNTLFLSHGESLGNFYTKTIIISWLLVVLVVGSCFTANLSSILVTAKLKPVVDKTIIGCDSASFVLNYLQSVLNYKKENIVQIEGQKYFAPAFENGKITAAYLELPYVRVFLSKYKNYAVYGERQMLGGFSFALQQGDPMAPDLSTVILALAEDGTIKKLQSRWFSVSLSNFGNPDSSADVESLDIDVFGNLFIFSFVVIVLTLVTFTVHICRHGPPQSPINQGELVHMLVSNPQRQAAMIRNHRALEERALLHHQYNA